MKLTSLILSLTFFAFTAQAIDFNHGWRDDCLNPMLDILAALHKVIGAEKSKKAVDDSYRRQYDSEADQAEAKWQKSMLVAFKKADALLDNLPAATKKDPKKLTAKFKEEPAFAEFLTYYLGEPIKPINEEQFKVLYTLVKKYAAWSVKHLAVDRELRDPNLVPLSQSYLSPLPAATVQTALDRASGALKTDLKPLSPELIPEVEAKLQVARDLFEQDKVPAGVSAMLDDYLNMAETLETQKPFPYARYFDGPDFIDFVNTLEAWAAIAP